MHTQNIFTQLVSEGNEIALSRWTSFIFLRLHLIQKAIKDECRNFFCLHLWGRRVWGRERDFRDLCIGTTGDSLSRACSNVCWFLNKDNCCVFLWGEQEREVMKGRSRFFFCCLHSGTVYEMSERLSCPAHELSLLTAQRVAKFRERTIICWFKLVQMCTTHHKIDRLSLWNFSCIDN